MNCQVTMIIRTLDCTLIGSGICDKLFHAHLLKAWFLLRIILTDPISFKTCSSLLSMSSCTEGKESKGCLDPHTHTHRDSAIVEWVTLTWTCLASRVTRLPVLGALCKRLSSFSFSACSWSSFFSASRTVTVCSCSLPSSFWAGRKAGI